MNAASIAIGVQAIDGYVKRFAEKHGENAGAALDYTLRIHSIMSLIPSENPALFKAVLNLGAGVVGSYLERCPEGTDQIISEAVIELHSLLETFEQSFAATEATITSFCDTHSMMQ